MTRLIIALLVPAVFIEASWESMTFIEELARKVEALENASSSPPAIISRTVYQTDTIALQKAEEVSRALKALNSRVNDLERRLRIAEYSPLPAPIITHAPKEIEDRLLLLSSRVGSIETTLQDKAIEKLYQRTSAVCRWVTYALVWKSPLHPNDEPKCDW